MFNEPNLELVVLCVTLLIETSIRPDLTEMLRPYSQTCKVIYFIPKYAQSQTILRISNCIYRGKNGMVLPAAQPHQKRPVVSGLSTL